MSMSLGHGARAKVYAPVAVVGLDVSEHTAKARLRRPDGDVDVLHCQVEPERRTAAR